MGIFRAFFPSHRSISRVGVFTTGVMVMKMLILLILVSIKSRGMDKILLSTKPRCAECWILHFEGCGFVTVPWKGSAFWVYLPSLLPIPRSHCVQFNLFN